MARLKVPTRDEAPAASRPMLDRVQERLGSIPNLYRLIANSPAAFAAYTAISGALTGKLDPRTREGISLAVAQVNGSDYCLSSHSHAALNIAGISQEEAALNRLGESLDAKAAAAIRFAEKVARDRGHVRDADIAEIRLAGFDDGQIVEIVAIVAECFLTNFISEVAKAEIDFPVVRAAEAPWALDPWQMSRRA